MVEQYIDIINDDNEAIGKAKRDEIFKKKLLHRAIKVIIVNDKKEFLICKIPNNKMLSEDKFELGIWSEVLSEETFDDAMFRTLNESFKIDAPPIFIKQFRHEIESNKAIVNLYVLAYEEELKPTKNVTLIKFVPISKVEEMCDNNEISPISQHIFLISLEEIKELSK
ncbi:MAG: hypothetical protein ACMXYG_02490 [Candidatus Woesearchaeota archaeon]